MTEKKGHKPTQTNSDGNKGDTNPSFKTRFQKGRSGNPSGRPVGSRNRSKIVEAILNAKITIRDGERSRTITKFELLVIHMVNDAAKGDPKAQAQVLAWIRVFGLTATLPLPEVRTPLTANDDELLADFCSRLRDDPSAKQNSNNPEVGGEA